jgi:phosphoribosylanthranilate isomerase
MVELGVDQVGFVAGDYGMVHAELTFIEARAIVEELRGHAISSALTMSTDIDEIVRMTTFVQPDIVHISSDTEALGVDALQRLKTALPMGTDVMKAVHVSGPESIDVALHLAPAVDILLLDTKVSGMPGVGATGITHDWKISHDIVRNVGTQARVILAGGLTPDNVSDAIKTVRPWGVDSNTGTNIPGDPVMKDWRRVAAFVSQTRQATSYAGI